MADPGFSEEWAPTLKDAIILPFFPQKLHEIERIWTPGGILESQFCAHSSSYFMLTNILSSDVNLRLEQELFVSIRIFVTLLVLLYGVIYVIGSQIKI